MARRLRRFGLEFALPLVVVWALLSSCASTPAPVADHDEKPERPAEAAASGSMALPTVQLRSDGKRLRLGDLGIEFAIGPRWHVARLDPQHVTLFAKEHSIEQLQPTIDLLIEARQRSYDAPALLQSQLRRAFIHLSVAGSSDIRRLGRWDAVFGPYGLVSRGQVLVAAKVHEVRWHYYDASSAQLHFVIAALCASGKDSICQPVFTGLVDRFEAAIGVHRSGS